MSREKRAMNEQVSMLQPDQLQPLAARLRPETLDDIIGQKHLLGPGKSCAASWRAIRFLP